MTPVDMLLGSAIASNATKKTLKDEANKPNLNEEIKEEEKETQNRFNNEAQQINRIKNKAEALKRIKYLGKKSIE